MKLTKKQLAARTLHVGVDRIVFNKERLADIKEAITKQDIRDLVKDNAIFIKEVQGRRAKLKQKSRRREGSVRKKVKSGKQEYVLFVRKSRAYIARLKEQEHLTPEQARTLRKDLRSRRIATKTHLHDQIKQVKSS